MRIGITIGSHAISTGALTLAFFATSIASSGIAWAKHNKTPTTSNADPCAAPTAFVKDHIQKIRVLQASLNAKKSTVFGMFNSNSNNDPDTVAKIADMRHDADGVNDLLRAGGCKPLDIDQELKSGAPPPPSPPVQAKKKHKHQ